MNAEVEKIYNYVSKMEDFYYGRIDECPNTSSLMTAQAISFQKVRYFIEDMEDENESRT